MRPHLETPFPNVDRSVYCVCYERRGSPRRSWCLWRRCRSLAAWRFGTFPSFRPTAYTRPGSMSTPPLRGTATKPGGISWSPVRFPAQAELRGRPHGQHGDIHDHARGTSGQRSGGTCQSSFGTSSEWTRQTPSVRSSFVQAQKRHATPVREEAGHTRLDPDRASSGDTTLARGRRQTSRCAGGLDHPTLTAAHGPLIPCASCPRDHVPVNGLRVDPAQERRANLAQAPDRREKSSPAQDFRPLKHTHSTFT